MKLLIIGAGGHGKVVAEVAQAMRDCNGHPMYEQIGYLDDHAAEAVGTIAELETIGANYDEVFCGIGNNHLRGELLERAEQLGFAVATLIHPTAFVSPSAMIKLGTVVEPMAMVHAGTVVEEGCIISLGAIVDHDVHVGRYCHVNAGSVCKARSSVDAYVKVDSGVIIRPKDN